MPLLSHFWTIAALSNVRTVGEAGDDIAYLDLRVCAGQPGGDGEGGVHLGGGDARVDHMGALSGLLRRGEEVLGALDVPSCGFHQSPPSWACGGSRNGGSMTRSRWRLNACLLYTSDAADERSSV